MTQSKNRIEFVRASLGYLQDVRSWLEEPHVREFWDNSPNHKGDIKIFMEGRKTPSPYFEGIYDYWIGLYEGRPYALMMTSEVLEDDSDLPKPWRPHLSQTGKTFSIDFMIGDPKYVGKGLGAQTLNDFMKFFIQQIEQKADTFIIDPAQNNPRAKHVYEKAGFRSVDDFVRGGVDFIMMIKRVYLDPVVVPAVKEEYPTIQNMARFYIYDMSRTCGVLAGWECPNDGLYECFNLERYFLEEDRFPFLIRIGEELGGFVLINKVGTSNDVDWNMAEFFILAKFQGQGMGEQVAFQVFDQFKGVWECAAIPQNTPAIQFWDKTIAAYTMQKYGQEKFTRSLRTLADPKPHPMIIWRFDVI